MKPDVTIIGTSFGAQTKDNVQMHPEGYISKNTACLEETVHLYCALFLIES